LNFFEKTKLKKKSFKSHTSLAKVTQVSDVDYQVSDVAYRGLSSI
jgi:hypothetical protein